MWRQALSAICGAVFGIALIVTCSSPGSGGGTYFGDVPFLKDAFSGIDVGVKDAHAATPSECTEWRVTRVGSQDSYTTSREPFAATQYYIYLRECVQ